MDFLWTILIILVVVGLVVGAIWLLKGYFWGGEGATNLFGSVRERRIGLVDSSSIDGRRKLLLIRRDGVEHLVMTGGPIDVVIETGIQDQRRQAFDRPARVDPRDAARQPPMARPRQAAPAPSLEP